LGSAGTGRRRPAAVLDLDLQQPRRLSIRGPLPLVRAQLARQRPGELARGAHREDATTRRRAARRARIALGRAGHRAAWHSRGYRCKATRVALDIPATTACAQALAD